MAVVSLGSESPTNLVPRVLFLPRGRERTLGTRLPSHVRSFPSTRADWLPTGGLWTLWGLMEILMSNVRGRAAV